MKKIVSLLLALSILLTFALAEERIELMTFGGTPVYLDEVQNYTELLSENGYCESATDYLSGLEYVLRYIVGIDLLIPDPSAWLNEDESASATVEAGEYYDESVQSYVDYYAASDATEDDRAALALEAVTYFGITREEYINSALLDSAYNKMLDSYDIEVTDEEIEEMYAEEVAYEMSAISSVYMYELYSQYGYSFFFRPEGYRGITHILLLADDDLCTAYSSAATDEEKTAAAGAIIASKQETIDAIYAAFNAGTPFADLIAQYGEDPGMTDPTYLAEGYSVHPESMSFVSEFTAGAFSDAMQQVGDISDPVVTSYGVHILYYLRDIPGGALPMTDDIREEIRSYAAQNKQSDCITEALKAFEVTYTDAYAQYIGTENFLDK